MMKKLMKKVMTMFKVIGVLTVLYFAWNWGVISAVTNVASRVMWALST
jgi:hypothetical protein